MKSTNYYNTFITVADDCARTQGTVPPEKTPPTVAALQYKMIAENPYKFTSDEILFNVHCQRNGTTTLQDFFSKGQACLRCSAIPQRYGWGIHFNADGKLALYGRETSDYQQKKTDKNLEQKHAFARKK